MTRLEDIFPHKNCSPVTFYGESIPVYVFSTEDHPEYQEDANIVSLIDLRLFDDFTDRVTEAL